MRNDLAVGRWPQMPRYFFHVHDDIDALDEEGQEFPNSEAALNGATGAARQLAAEQVTQGKLHLDHRIEVADDSGKVIATIAFRDCVEIEG